MIFVMLFWVPVAALLWLAVVSHVRFGQRIAAAAAAMVTFVGSLAAPGIDSADLAQYRIANGREALALIAATTGSVYLLVWSRLHRGRGRNRTLAVLAAIIGLVPIVAALALATIYSE